MVANASAITQNARGSVGFLLNYSSVVSDVIDFRSSHLRINVFTVKPARPHPARIEGAKGKQIIITNCPYDYIMMSDSNYDDIKVKSTRTISS